jgi:quercetin dioxygenase-like cupin family protein
MKNEVRKISWEALEEERLSETVSRQMVSGEKATLTRMTAKNGAEIPRHSHPNEEYMMVTSGALRYQFDDSEMVVNAGDVLIVPPDVSHSIRVEGDASFFVFFTPVREDWLRGEDQYLRR